MVRNPGYDSKMGHRVVDGLRNAWLSPRPTGMPISRPRGVKKLGHTYEANFGKALQVTTSLPSERKISAGQWFHFVDDNGFGYCQTDWLYELSNEVIIFECKLTDTDRGRSQLSRLYFPVVQKVFGKLVRGIVVTRHLTKETELPLVTDQLQYALGFPRDVIPTLHWRERTPL